MRARYIFFLIVFSIYAIVSYATTIYKSTDKDGNITFSQEPSQNSIKIQISDTAPNQTSTTISKDIKKYQNEKTKNMLKREKINKLMIDIDNKLTELSKAKDEADAVIRECLTKPRIRLLDYSKCPENTIDKSECVIVKNIPTTPENCKRPAYHNLMKVIETLQSKRRELQAEMNTLK